MNQPRCISHKLKEGDSLYRLALYYQTSVAQIMARNPNLDPYNLQVGDSITICPGDHGAAQPAPEPLPEFTMDAPSQGGSLRIAPLPPHAKCRPLVKLSGEMRLAWLNHLLWTYISAKSILSQSPDSQAVMERLAETADDIVDVFDEYYPEAAVKNIENLLREHIRIGGELIRQIGSRQPRNAEQLNDEWYDNADALAKAFSELNPSYDREYIQQMLYRHLNIIKRIVQERRTGAYSEEIELFDEAQEGALEMADFFVSGIVEQFPQYFS